MGPKKFLFVSVDALSSDLAWQVQRQGHQVKFFTDKEEHQDIGQGFFPKTLNWRKEVEWADIIIFDEAAGQGVLADQLRKEGRLVIGGTSHTDKLESDRGFGQNELARHGIATLDHFDFESIDGAIEHIKKHP